MKTEPAIIANLTIKTEIEDSIEKVWTTLTDNIGDWWPDDFYAGGTAGARDFNLDLWPGGRMFETWADGGGVLWATVCTIDPGKCLQVLGHQFPNWGGPLQWYGTWQLESARNCTILSYSEGIIGRLSDSAMNEKDKGWRFLMSCLKAHVEGDSAPAWS